MAINGTPHSPKLQHYWNLPIRLFSVIHPGHSLEEGLTLLQRCSRYILQPKPDCTSLKNCRETKSDSSLKSCLQDVTERIAERVPVSLWLTWHLSKRVRTSVALWRSVSEYYSWERYGFLIPPVIGKIVQLLLFYKDVFGIKYPTKVYMPLNKETKPKTCYPILNIWYKFQIKIIQDWLNSNLNEQEWMNKSIEFIKL